MRINANDYESRIVSLYKDKAVLFGELLEHFANHSFSNLSCAEFNVFSSSTNLAADEEELENQLYDLFNYLRLYREGGVFFLYKNRQAEWNGPPVILTCCDAPNSDLHVLINGNEIYRGMSREEFELGQFGQSWTKEIDVARRFAFDTYSDCIRGVVASCNVQDVHPIYYSDTDSEAEIIVEYGSVKSAKIVET